MRADKWVAVSIASVVAWYTSATKEHEKEYTRTSSLEDTLEQNPSHAIYVTDNKNGQSLGNLAFLDYVLKESKNNGLYDRLESFLEEKYGQAPREQYRIGHDDLEEDVTAYTNNTNTIGVGPKFEENSKMVADNYNISPTLAAIISYGHERGHMAIGPDKYLSTKDEEINVDSAMEEFLLREEALARSEGRLIDAQQFNNAALYQRNRVTAIQNDLIERYAA